MKDHSTQKELQEQAIAWVVRVGDPAFDDWEAFEGWLSKSSSHAEAYHTAAAAEADMLEIITTMPAAPPVAPMPVHVEARRFGRGRALFAGAIAASALALVGYGLLSAPADRSVSIETGRGEQRTVELVDGSHAILNGATRIVVAAGGREITLDQGQALFTVVHDSDHPFRLKMGDAIVQDVGTVFDATRESGASRVAVAEGAVELQGGANAIRVDAGKMLRTQDGNAQVVLSRVSAPSVGGWSRGELAFDGVPLSSAIADMARAVGTPVEITPTIASLAVRGTISLSGGANVAVPRLAVLLGLQARRSGIGWKISPPGPNDG